SDAPRRVWGSFAVGLWLWVIAESVWGYLNVTQGEVAEGPADIFWITSYFFLGRALFLQFQILVRPTVRELWNRVLIALLFLLALCLLIFSMLSPTSTGTDKWDVAINSFYPAADLLLALVAFWLARHFIGGAFARPWLGLLVFTFADLMYAWLEISGMYSWSVDQGNLFSTIADITYLSAYVVLGLGALSQWVFLKYGLRPSTEPR
ncbi:MAG TPA: hypothetical protein VK206_24475, partial [Anaerolineales bacterium]|nr:hypothetical protein [Anaerolineales bacterium]